VMTAIAGKLGRSPDSLRVWIRRVQRDGGARPGLSSVEKARIKELERKDRELRQANDILKKAPAYLPALSQFADKSLPGSGRSSATRSANDCFD
jgi:transposase-like protein